MHKPAPSSESTESEVPPPPPPPTFNQFLGMLLFLSYTRKQYSCSHDDSRAHSHLIDMHRVETNPDAAPDAGSGRPIAHSRTGSITSGSAAPGGGLERSLSKKVLCRSGPIQSLQLSLMPRVCVYGLRQAMQLLGLNDDDVGVFGVKASEAKRPLTGAPSPAGPPPAQAREAWGGDNGAGGQASCLH